ncbi:MAG: bifunctional [glutamine synthetase] adenylyltransferase/[glutamine synthetase]-adenylyl-L-tyrosine phosphorylase [Microbacteriaceae bacterium]|nr:bifunctional [glutamine synthetase] adenylyltransferase/[glutamine synthetase]-adenylyl-L-tyrosine phosphorylase [Microbacteriaceae bacterium]
MARNENGLTELARLGFADLDAAGELLAEVGARHQVTEILHFFAAAADPDLALRQFHRLWISSPIEVKMLVSDAAAAGRLIQVLGASTGLAEFLLRCPEELHALAEALEEPLSALDYRADLSRAVAETVNLATAGEDAWTVLRVRYRRHLVRLTAWDLAQPDPLAAVDGVAAALADLAGAALDAALLVARAQSSFPADEVAATRLAVIGMGKSGARELNYVSDVDVIFVVAAGEQISSARAVDIATRLAKDTMRAIHDFGREPELWEVDANLRPEGKDGALVRTLESHLAYYDRWAKSWEFQALLKARPLAGDLELGADYVAGVAPKVWSSASRENFVESVQRMRERVTANIPGAELPYQLKLGPGGLRDIEFTVQLLQLVHGQTDTLVRQPGSLPALAALAERGYIGRAESAEFSRDYRLLRVLEHRMQLSRMRRTHLMPSDPDALRILARSTGLAIGAAELIERWNRTKITVRSLHERLFYRPLLSAVAGLRADEVSLSSEQASARLSAIGFSNARGALSHIQALTAGVSRRAAIQRHLLPVMLQWFADGADPDYGLLAFRRLSEDLGESHWFLRMLRDSSGAAKSLTTALSSARFIGVLMESVPEAAAWFDSDEELQPRSLEALIEECRAINSRHDNVEESARALRTVRRREVLRLAIAAILGVIDVERLGTALSDVTSSLLTGILELIHPPDDGIEFGIVGMGRYGGRELGFGSDTDIVYVYRPTTATQPESQARAEGIVAQLGRLTDDVRLPLDLDAGLRPEGKNGAIVRSLESYRAYYARWSLTWEAQALLRAHGVAGDRRLLIDFELMADSVRYPVAISEPDVREVKRIKARVESERLPQGADPARHLKLGRGSLSDVEWFVQLIQLRHAAQFPALRTTSTLEALAAAASLGYLTAGEAKKLRAAWILASRARSAMTLWMVRTTDVLPVDRAQLEGIARLMNYPPGSASLLDEDYLRVTRLARQVFEKRFYDSV